MKKILVTGVFDLLHQEHINFLTKAKAVGDILVVGLETDTRVKQLKGFNRPINSTKDRLQNLENLKIADKIFTLPKSFNTPQDHLALLQKIKPDILAVSSHTPNLTNKKQLMKKIGGAVKVVHQLNPHISSSKLASTKLK